MKRILQTLMGVCQATVLVAALGLGTSALASEGGFPLDKAPDRVSNNASLQNGAKIFVNYCLNCHSANYMRYNRLQDIGLTEKQIKDNLLFAGEKVGDTMRVTMNPKDAKKWFGAAPPSARASPGTPAGPETTGACPHPQPWPASGLAHRHVPRPPASAVCCLGWPTTGSHWQFQRVPSGPSPAAVNCCPWRALPLGQRAQLCAAPEPSGC